MPTTEAVTTAAQTTVESSTQPITTVVSTTEVPSCFPTDTCDGGHYVCNNDTGEKICNDGYKGTDCKDRDFSGQDDPNCPSMGSCKNGGTCWNNTCCCLKGYDGILCNEDIIECLSDPCVNGGTCKDEVGGYRCKCHPGKYCKFGAKCVNNYIFLPMNGSHWVQIIQIVKYTTHQLHNGMANSLITKF